MGLDSVAVPTECALRSAVIPSSPYGLPPYGLRQVGGMQSVLDIICAVVKSIGGVCADKFLKKKESM